LCQVALQVAGFLQPGRDRLLSRDHFLRAKILHQRWLIGGLLQFLLVKFQLVVALI
jgi:hypothetical protein